MHDSFKQAIVYQIYPKSFYDSNKDGIGDLKGIISKIPYLKQLGVNVLWLSPVFSSPMADNGYDISDYCNIHPDYGTLEDVKDLIEILHKNQMKLLLDLVVNHTSDEHPWFQESKSSIDNDKRDYYIWRKGKNNNTLPPNNWTSFFTGKAWSFNHKTNMWYLRLFDRKQPDLNWDNPKVRDEVKKIMRFWLDLGVDGFRCDVINLISKNSALPNGRKRLALTGLEHYLNGPHVHEYIKELHRDVLANYACFTVGEATFVAPDEGLKYVHKDNKELDMLFHFEHMAVDTINNKWFIRKYKPKRLKKVLIKWQEIMYPHGWNALYLENHDQPRSVSRFGNTKKYWVESATMLAAMFMLQRGTPYIYQGQEIGMTNAGFTQLDQYKDVETHNIYNIGRQKLKLTHRRMMKKIKYMSRDNARTPMQWNQTKYAGFTKATPWIEVNSNYPTINVKNQLDHPQSIWKFYQSLITLRKEHKVFIEGQFIPHYTQHSKLFVYERKLNQEIAIVIANMTRKKTTMRFPANHKYADFDLILTNKPDNHVIIHLKPYEARIYLKRK